MTYFLAQTLINLRSRIVTASLQREISKHTGIPDAAADTLAEECFIANVKTVTGWTDKGTRAAAQAGVGHLLPKLRFVKKIF